MAQTQRPAMPAGAFGAGMANAKPQLETLKMPAGFQIAVYAEGVQGARSMALAPDGTLFVGTRGNKVYVVTDANKDQVAEKVTELATSLRTPNGLAFRDGALFVGELNRIVRFDSVLEAVKAGGTGLTPKVVLEGLPSDFMHGWKYIAFGPDGYLYYQIGAPCNVCDRGDPYASIWRVKPDGSGNEIFARGVRNSVGIDWHPITKQAFFTENGRDNLGDEQPNDELNRAAKPGLHFGYPYCHEGTIADPEFGTNRPCSNFEPPAHKLGPHVAAVGLKFYTGSMFPAEVQEPFVHRATRIVESHASRRTGGLSHHDGDHRERQGCEVPSSSRRGSCRVAWRGAVLSICCRCQTAPCSCQTTTRVPSTGSPTESRGRSGAAPSASRRDGGQASLPALPALPASVTRSSLRV